REGVEASLRNLRTDYIDLYQVHWPDPNTPADETGRALADLVREGKIRHAGVSNYSPRQMTELARYGPVETDQPLYHMFHRDIEAEILPYAAKNDIGVLVYGPLAHGLLSGTMTPQTTFAADDWRGSSADFKGGRLAVSGFALTVWDRTTAKAQTLNVGRVAPTPAEAIRDADIVISSLTNAAAVRDVYLGPQGAFESSAGMKNLFVEMSTAGPES